MRSTVWLRLAACGVAAALSTGCIANKNFWLKTLNPKSGTYTVGGEYQKGGLQPPLVLTNEQITNQIVGTETNGVTRVSYGKELQPQAALLARILEQTFAQTERALETVLSVRPHVYMLRLENEAHVIQFRMSVPDAQHSMPWLMVLTNPPPDAVSNPEALWADLRELPGLVFLVTHESTELHLIDPKQLLVMGDFTGSMGFLHFTLKYHTRWFRDGYANYVAYKAAQSLRRQLAEESVPPGTLRFLDISDKPLSELARVKEKLFDWDQNSKDDFYDAATGLFLLIEHRKGPQALANVIRELPNVKFPNGKGLLKMIRQKTGLDLRQFVRTFQFPDLGLELHADGEGQFEIETVRPDTPASHAGLLKGDILLEANNTPIVGLPDLELQVLNARERGQTLSLTYLRSGERHKVGLPAWPFDK